MEHFNVATEAGLVPAPGKCEGNLVLIKEEGTGSVFAVEASYIESEVGPVRSPYGNGTLVLGSDPYVDGAYLEPDYLKEQYSKADKGPDFSRVDWVKMVCDGTTELGYWECVSEFERAKEKSRLTELPSENLKQWKSVCNVILEMAKPFPDALMELFSKHKIDVDHLLSEIDSLVDFRSQLIKASIDQRFTQPDGLSELIGMLQSVQKYLEAIVNYSLDLLSASDALRSEVYTAKPDWSAEELRHSDAKVIFEDINSIPAEILGIALHLETIKFTFSDVLSLTAWVAPEVVIGQQADSSDSESVASAQ